MSRFWSRAEAKELGEIIERLGRDGAAVARLCSSPGRHGMIRGLGLTAAGGMTAARVELEHALRISEEDDS